MPVYDFRCEDCRDVFSIRTRTYAEYDSAALSCPTCGSAELARLISRVAIAGMRRDYSKMTSGDMLSVLESGDGKQVDDMFKQVGGGEAADRTSAGQPLRQAHDRK